MSWASIASNQCVSFNNLQDAVNNGVFVIKNSIPVSLEQITKADADYHVYIDTSYGPYASKASNQLIVKSDLVSDPPCNCYSLENTDSIDISINYVDCQLGTTCAVCPASSTIYLCIPSGQQSNYFVSYGTGCGGGTTPSYVFTSLGGVCTTSGDCP